MRGERSGGGGFARGGGFGCGGHSCGFRAVDEILELLAGLEERNFLRRHFHFGASLWIAAHPPAPLPRAEAPKSANLDLVALLQSVNDALEDGFDDGLRFLARKLGHAQHFLDQVGLRQCRLLAHGAHASSYGKGSFTCTVPGCPCESSLLQPHISMTRNGLGGLRPLG